jgi:nucleotide-binding universal stress UspA family protein
VAAVAGGRDADVAASYAAREAAARGTSLELVHVLRPGTARPAGGLEEVRVGALRRAQQVAAAEAPLVPVIPTLLSGPVAESLVAHAESAALLVVGSSEEAPTDPWVPEALSTELATRAACPVTVVPREAGPTVVRRVVVGLRWPPHEDEALLEEAFAAAERWHCDLEVVHAGRAQGSRRDPPTPRGHDPGWVPGLTALVEEHLVVPRRRHPGVHVRVDVVRSSPAEALMDSVGPGTVLLVSRTSDTRSGPVLGATSRSVLHLARCAVELVPARLVQGPR